MIMSANGVEIGIVRAASRKLPEKSSVPSNQLDAAPELEGVDGKNICF